MLLYYHNINSIKWYYDLNLYHDWVDLKKASYDRVTIINPEDYDKEKSDKQTSDVSTGITRSIRQPDH